MSVDLWDLLLKIGLEPSISGMKTINVLHNYLIMHYPYIFKVALSPITADRCIKKEYEPLIFNGTYSPLLI